MKIEQGIWTGMVVAALMAAAPGVSASLPEAAGVPTQMVVTVRPGPGSSQPATLEAPDLTVLVDKTPARVVGLQRLAGDLADMQLVVLLDDSTRSTSAGIQLPELKKFVESLPATTQVAVGYMRNGSVAMAGEFTVDHQQAADALRLPMGMPGENGSPYFALSDLAKHWPSKQSTDRRAVLMLTDGVDRYWGTAIMDDPYVDAAVRDTLKQGVMVYSIYLRGAGAYDRGGWVTNFGQSRLLQLSQETGGSSYFQGFADPVTIAPFLSDFRNRLDHQYQVTLDTVKPKGVQPVKVHTELPGLKIESPTRVYVR